MFLKPVAAVLNGKPCVGEKIEVYWSETACRVVRLRGCFEARRPQGIWCSLPLRPPPHPLHRRLAFLSSLRRSLVANTQRRGIKKKRSKYRYTGECCLALFSLLSLGVLVLAFPQLLLTKKHKLIIIWMNGSIDYPLSYLCCQKCRLKM